MRRNRMPGVRDHIAERLRYEARRKALSELQIAERAGLPEDVVVGYFRAQREIVFAELNPMCAALAVAPMRLLAKRFDQSRLAFRRVNAADLAAVGRIEEAFLLIREHLPRPQIPRVQAPDISEADPGLMLGTLIHTVDELRAVHPRVEDLLHWLGLPVLPVWAGPDGFDACLLNCAPHFAICINRDKPLVRIHFSLLHEIAHFLFDRERDIPLDANIFEFYRDQISAENRPEYVANKFAQNFMVPFAEAEAISKKPPGDKVLCERLSAWRASVDVLTHALYDQAQLARRRPSYQAIRADLEDRTGNCAAPDLSGIRALLDDQTSAVAAILERHAAGYADDVLDEIREALSVG